MAAINFLYRSTKPESFLIIRLLFRDGSNDYQFGSKTKIKVSKYYWEKQHSRNRIKDIDIKNLQTEVNSKIRDLENYILDAFNNANPNEVSKQWLKNAINFHHNPPQKNTEIPKDLITFIDYYLEQKKYDLSEIRMKRIRVVKHKLERFAKGKKSLTILSINEDFKNDYTSYCNSQSYSLNTQQTELSIIKTICSYAHKKGLKTNPELTDIAIKGESVNNVYLTITEIEAIKKIELEADYLDNARDLLLISCYTGQRVSDFMRFNSGMIRFENDRYFLDFKQKKTKKLMTIPFIKEARIILDKRDGNFPRAISHPKYNDYIKEVCRLAKSKAKRS